MHCCLQDASARARDISCRLRKRPAIRYHGSSVAPPWDVPALGSQDHYVHQETRSPKHYGCASTVRHLLHWLPVKWRINYKIVVLVFRALHGLAPAYVSTLITPYQPRRALRSAGSAQLCVPRHNLERYGRRSFSCAGPVLWNSLPEDMRLADSLDSFKSHLKTHYFKLAYNLWLYTYRTSYMIFYFYLLFLTCMYSFILINYLFIFIDPIIIIIYILFFYFNFKW